MPPRYDDGLALLTSEIVHTSSSRAAVLTYAVQYEDTTPTAPQIAELFQVGFRVAMFHAFDTSCLLTKTTCLLGLGDAGFTTGESTEGPTAGTHAMSSLPPNCAAVVKKLTGVGGREGRGRFYLPWVLSESAVDEAGNFGGADLTDLQGYLDDWQETYLNGTFDGHTWVHVIPHRTYDRAWTEPNRRLTRVDAGPAVTSLNCETLIGTQRRRLR